MRDKILAISNKLQLAKITEKEAKNHLLVLFGVLNPRELLVAYEEHMLRSTEGEHRLYWAEKTVDNYINNH